MIYNGREHDIIEQYVRSSKVITEEARRTPDDLRAAAERTIDRCLEENVLVAFLTYHEAEVHNTIALDIARALVYRLLQIIYREVDRVDSGGSQSSVPCRSKKIIAARRAMG